MKKLTSKNINTIAEQTIEFIASKVGDHERLIGIIIDQCGHLMHIRERLFNYKAYFSEGPVANQPLKASKAMKASLKKAIKKKK